MFNGQNLEDQEIFKYFNGEVNICLSIGENNGTDYSNVLVLIQHGWGALLVEPSEKVFPALMELHDSNEKIFLVKTAIGSENKKTTLFDSGGYLLRGTSSLLSTIIPSEKDRWGDVVQWEEVEVPVITFETLLNDSPYKKFQFISIDAEGEDWNILTQMNLSALDCQCICLEHNSVSGVKEKMYQYCATFGLTKILATNAENIIIAK